MPLEIFKETDVSLVIMMYVEKTAAKNLRRKKCEQAYLPYNLERNLSNQFE